MQDMTAKEARKFASGFKYSVLVGEEANDNVGKQSFLPHQSEKRPRAVTAATASSLGLSTATPYPTTAHKGWGDGGVGKVLAG